MRTLYLIALLLAMAGCMRKGSMQASLITLDSLNYSPEDSARLARQGIRVARLNAKQALLIQPQKKQGKVKVKNSYNADSYNKKSNNTKAKGESIIGDANAPVEAKKHAIIGDGNTVQEEESLWWLWLLIGASVVAVAWAWWKRDYG